MQFCSTTEHLARARGSVAEPTDSFGAPIELQGGYQEDLNGGWFSGSRKLSPTKEPMMSLTFAVALNLILAATAVVALAYVCRIPYRLDRVARPRELWVETEEFEPTAAERVAA
jgi:hypothetical protein